MANNKKHDMKTVKTESALMQKKLESMVRILEIFDHFKAREEEIILTLEQLENFGMEYFYGQRDGLKWDQEICQKAQARMIQRFKKVRDEVSRYPIHSFETSNTLQP